MTRSLQRSSTSARARRHPAAVEAPSSSASESLSPRMFSRVKDAILHVLSHRERLMLVLWYVERMTVAEISRTLDLTEQQVARMHADVVAKLHAAA
ncbi:MAG: hypothetical protein J0L61_01475 [Planctomycetes bacterium]|nr:hypothetical protein [Planctomycetota bacterium]